MALGASAACTASTEPQLRVGVDDVFKACQVRVAWKESTAETCVNCLAAAVSPACECEAFKEFGGLCHAQDEARRAEPSCTGASEDCARACGAGCSCLEACYVQTSACKRLIDARDGCVVDVCTRSCD